MELVIIMIITSLFSGGLVWGIMAYYKSKYEASKYKISDLEVLKIMGRANHFITSKQLAEVTPLNLSEAKDRLNYLAVAKVVRGYQDGNGVMTVFHLIEDLPENKNLPINIHGLTNQQVVDLILEYSDNHQVTIAELMVLFGLEIEAAKQLLKRLKKSGLVGRLWKGMSLIHVIKNPSKTARTSLETITTTEKIALPNHSFEKDPIRLKIPDADVLKLAIEHKGRLTATLLCLKLKISMQEAQLKLEELYEQGAFIMDVNEKEAIVEYHLRDRNLLS